MIYLLIFGLIATGAATLIEMLNAHCERRQMSLWSVITGLIFFADVFALANLPAAEKYPNAPFVVAERIMTPIDVDGKNRLKSEALCRLAQKQADRNATNDYPLGHTRLNDYIEQFGVMAENSGTAPDWESMYKIWRNSPDHLTNIRSGLQYMGYAVATSVSGQKCYVVVYGSRDGIERKPR